MNGSIQRLSASIRNIFSVGKIMKREDNNIQVETSTGTVLEGIEAHPYGFKAKANKGKVIVISPGGNFENVEFLSTTDYHGGPQLNDNDVAIYTEKGGFIICRENGEVELFGKSYGGLIKVDELRTQLARLTARVDGIMNALRNSPTAPQDGGAAYRLAIINALNALTNKEDFSSIASEEVFHGNGS